MFYFNILFLLLLLFVFSIIGMMMDSNLLLKFIICYELFLLVFLLSMLFSSINVFIFTIMLLVLFNTVFESMLGLSVFYLLLFFIYYELMKFIFNLISFLPSLVSFNSIIIFYIMGLLFYMMSIMVLSVVFSISLCSSINSYLSMNFECGFYSIMLLIMKYKFNYWMIMLHFMIFEQELMICMMMMYGGNCSINWMLVLQLVLMLFIDLLMHMLYNFGPQHPATHGVFSCINMCNGEMMKYMITEIGLLHSGTEKLILINNNNISYFDSLDYMSIITQELLFLQTLEMLMNNNMKLIISLWSMLLIECYSNLNHLLNMTTHAIDIGLFSTMVWTFEESEKLIIFIEGLTGTSFHSAFLLLGSLSYNMSLFWIDSFIYWLINFIIKIKEIHYFLSYNSLWSTSLYEIGIIEKNIMLFYGMTGLLSSSVKIGIDASFNGYEFYNKLSYTLYLSSNGDCLDSYLLSFNEIIETMKMNYLCLCLL